MSVLMIVILGVITAFAAIFSLCWICHTHEVRKKLREHPHDYVKLTFKQLKSFYAVAPTKWKFFTYSDLPEYRQNYHTTVTILFSFWDFIRYNAWVRKKNKRDTQSENDETMLEYMDYWKQDTERYAEKARREMDEARTKILKITEELKNRGYTVDDGGVSDSKHIPPVKYEYI